MERLLTTTGRLCPFGCCYCFAASPSYQPFLNLVEVTKFQEIIAGYEYIQLACDTELFLNPPEALRLLREVVEANQNVSFITKMALSDRLIEKIALVSQEAKLKGLIVSGSISLTSLDSVAQYEPYSATPEQRINTLKNLYHSGIHTRVALRPLIPSVSLDELLELVDLTLPYTYGYYSGPLWLERLNQEMVSPGTVISKRPVPWMAGNPRWYCLEHPQKQQALAEYIQQRGSKLYQSSVEAIAATQFQYLAKVS